MSLSLLVPLPEGLEITAISDTPEAVVVRVLSHRSSSHCPICSTPSSAIHSYYRRKPADLPCLGRQLRLVLTVKKFFCRVASCPRKVFTERIPDLLEPCSRLTTRLRTAIQAIGFASTGKAGARLAAKLGMPLSDTTLLWSLHLVPVPPIKDVKIVGIDDVKAAKMLASLRKGAIGHQAFPIAKVDELEKKLRDAGVKFEFHRYNAKHAFANETADSKNLAMLKYDPAAADLAWRRTMEFFGRNLK